MFSLSHIYTQLSVPICNMHIERKSTQHIHAAAISVHGRRNNQEDSHTIDLHLNDNGLMLFGVFDGHGGPQCADWLSKALPVELAKITDIRYENELTNIFVQLDKQFLAQDLSDDGSTACVVLGQYWDQQTCTPLTELPQDYSQDAYPDIVIKILAINVGDSRAMIVNSTEYVPLTMDHKPEDPMELDRIINAGGTVTSSRIDGSLALSRSFGDKHYKCNELLPYDLQKVIAIPTISTFIVAPNEMLIITCDGVFETELMDYTRVAAIARASRQYYTSDADPDLFDPAGVCRDIIAKSLAYGSCDNNTVLIAHFFPHNTPRKPLHPDGLEFIPGPCYALSPDLSFFRYYRSDISKYAKFSDVAQQIMLVDTDYMAYCQYRDKILLDAAVSANLALSRTPGAAASAGVTSNGLHYTAAQVMADLTANGTVEVPLHHEHPYTTNYPRTNSTICPIYLPQNRNKYPPWFSALVNACVSRYDDHDDIQ